TIGHIVNALLNVVGEASATLAPALTVAQWQPDCTFGGEAGEAEGSEALPSLDGLPPGFVSPLTVLGAKGTAEPLPPVGALAGAGAGAAALGKSISNSLGHNLPVM